MAPRPRRVERKDGTVKWRVQFREHPGENPTSEVFDTPEGAERFIEVGEEVGWAEARRIRHGTGRSLRVPTLAAWLDRHLEQLSASVTPGTVDDYRRMAARTWLPRLGRYPLDMLTREQVVAWVGWQRKQETHRSVQRRAKARAAKQPEPPAETYSPKSISNAQRFLSSLLHSADAELGLGNVAKAVQLPGDAEPAEMVFLTPAEFERLYSATPKRWQPLVALLAGSGCRWGEAGALRREDFDLDADVPSVRIARAWKRGERGGSYIGSPKSRRGIRSVSLSPSTVAAVRELVESTELGQLVFRGARGGRIAAQNFHPRVWQPAVSASGIGKRPRVHDLRHSHASWLIHQGVPLTILQVRLGHESIKTTSDRYGHIMPEAHAMAADAVERAMGAFDASLVHAAELLPPDATTLQLGH